MNVKELFQKSENGTLTYEQLEELMKSNNVKLADLSEGNYVSKQKYEDELSVRDTRIQSLNDTVSTRDTDLAELKKQLADAGTDATKLSELGTNLNSLQSKYDKDTKALQKQLSEQAYKFAVKEYANSKKFTSNAAKRDFVNSMLSKNLQMDGDKIIGADDFTAIYSNDNADAFVVDAQPASTPASAPHFVQSSTPKIAGGDDNPIQFAFTGVR